MSGLRYQRGSSRPKRGSAACAPRILTSGCHPILLRYICPVLFSATQSNIGRSCIANFDLCGLHWFSLFVPDDTEDLRPDFHYESKIIWNLISVRLGVLCPHCK